MKKIDTILNKIISRKLMAWVVATILVVFGKIDGQEWMVVTSFYLVVQGVVDAKSFIQSYFSKSSSIASSTVFDVNTPVS